MPTPTPLKPDSDNDKLNVGQSHADDLFERHGVLDEGIASREGAVDQARSRLRSQENNPEATTNAADEELAKLGGGNGFYSPSSSGQAKTSYRGRFKDNKKLLTGLGFGGGAIMLLLVGFISFIPFKLEMMLKTVESQVAEIPQEAIESRLQYLTSRYLAMRLLGTNMPDTYPDTPFKSLYKTWRANNFEQKVGIKIESNRTNNHQTATSWKISLADESKPITVSGRNLDELTKEININNSKEMRRFIKGAVNENTHWASLYKRYAMRKTLMRTLGVTRWSWLPGASTLADKYNTKKLELKKSWVEKLTEGNVKVAGRTGLYMACLMSTDACNELHRRGFSTKVLPTSKDQPLIENCDSLKSKTQKKACEANNKKKEKYNDQLKNSGDPAAQAYEDAIGSIDADSPEATKLIRKLVIKQIMSKVLGPAALVDFIANTVESVDHGSINQIIYDRNSIMSGNVAAIYQSFNDQYKMTDADPAQTDVVMQQIAGFGSNPAWQAMAGVIKDPSNTTVSRDCVDRNGDTQTETLPKGQLVCDNKMLITDATTFTSASWWNALETLAHIWTSSVGKIFKVFNKIAGSVIDKLGIDDMIGWIMKIPGVSKLGDLLQTGILKMVNYIFGVPFTPFDTGANAADGIIAGLTASSFKLGESSIDFSEDGVTDTNASTDGLGIGGQILDPSEVAALHTQIAAANADFESHKPMLARVFDTNDTHSFVSQLAIRLPTSFAELKGFSSVLMNSITSMFIPKTAAAADMKNPFFDVNIAYGYKPGTTSYDPAMCTAEKTAELEQEREDSYTTYEHDGKKYIGVYTKTNPCALEKVVAAAATGDMTDTYPSDFALEGQDNGGANSGVDTNLKIATFNVQGASHKKEAGRDWKADLDKSMAVINDNSISIVGLQEFQSIQHDYFMSKMGDRYAIYPSTPEYGKGSAPPSVNSIIWDKSRFTLVKGGIQPGLKYFNGSPLHAPWVLLQDNTTYQQFYVLNTHDPAHPEYAYFRYYDANKHAAFVNSLKAEGVPIFFTGDFNSGYKVRDASAGNPTYQGKAENLTYCIMTGDGYLKDAYDLSENRLRKCPQPKGSNSVDHIFMSSEVKLNSFSTEPPSVNGSDVHDTLIADVTIPGSGSSNTFTAATYNLLNADGHTADSIHVAGGCNTSQDRACIQKRSELQAQIITGQDHNPAFDIIGTQETSPDQYRALKGLLPNYDSVPSSNADINRMSQQKNGATSIFWNTNKFRKIAEGKAPAISNVASTSNHGHITSPWVELETATGQHIYAISIHYPNSHFVDPRLGDAGTMREASKLTMQWVESVKQSDPSAMVLVMGDFNDMPGQKLSYCIYTQDGYLQNTYDMAKGLNPDKACPSTADSGKHGFSIDQVYASPLDGIKASNWTHMGTDAITAHASDHHPVYVTLRLAGGSQ